MAIPPMAASLGRSSTSSPGCQARSARLARRTICMCSASLENRRRAQIRACSGNGSPTTPTISRRTQILRSTAMISLIIAPPPDIGRRSCPEAIGRAAMARWRFAPMRRNPRFNWFGNGRRRAAAASSSPLIPAIRRARRSSPSCRNWAWRPIPAGRWTRAIIPRPPSTPRPSKHSAHRCSATGMATSAQPPIQPGWRTTSTCRPR